MARSSGGEFAYQRVYRYLKSLIAQASPGADRRLPSLRDLASRLQVSLATVQSAYSLLEHEGRVHSVPKSGYFVSAPSAESVRAATVGGERAPFLLPPIPAPALVRALLAHERRLARQSAAAAVPEAGNGSLRAVLAARHTRSSKEYWSAEDVHLATDVQSLLQTLLMALELRGATALVATPCCWRLLQALQQADMRVLEVPQNLQGELDMDILAQSLKREPVRLLLMPSTLSLPLGRVMSEQDQNQLARLLVGYPAWLLENDLDSEQCFAKPVGTRLRDWVDPQRLLVLGSLEALVGAEAPYAYVLSRKSRVRSAFIRRCFVLPPLRQQALAFLFSRGDMDGHLQQLRCDLQVRLGDLAEAVQRRLGAHVVTALADGGRALWCQVRWPVDLHRAIEALSGTALLAAPGDIFSLQGDYAHCLLLAWLGDRSDELNRALDLLGQALVRLREADAMPGLTVDQ